jgi:hypothetical protein
LDDLQSAAWEAFELSRQPIRETVTETKRRMRKLRNAEAKLQAAKKSLNGRGRAGTSCVPKALVVPARLTVIGTKEKSVSRSRPEGDARFLALVFWCIEARLKVLGLLQPQVNVNQTQNNYFDWEALVRPPETEPENPVEKRLRELAARRLKIEAEAQAQSPPPPAE